MANVPRLSLQPGDEQLRRRARRPRFAPPSLTVSPVSTPGIGRTVVSHGQILALQRLVGNATVARRLEGVAGVHPAAISPIRRVGTVITAKPNAGTSVHPTLTKGSANNAEAVTEAQQKLSTSPGGPVALPATGIFDAATEVAVKAFQGKNGLAESGVINKSTWDLLDAQGKSSVGRVERGWKQTLVPGDGSSYVTGMTSKYSYKIDATKIVVTVGINFVPDATHPPANLAAVVSKWKGRILGRWNQFKAVKDGGGEARDIVFEIVDSGGNTVNVIDAQVGSDAGNWSVPDNENDNGPAHEFGHMIGLEDEYQRGMDDYTRLHPETAKKDIEAAKGGFFGGEQYTNETSMMGTGALSGHADKSADPEPRHVREFVSFVEKFMGGTWEAVKK